MTSEKASTSADINALASEVMDLWQEHLAVYASDPKAKVELMRLLEPQRQLFADWASMMQNGFHAGNAASSSGSTPAAGSETGPSSTNVSDGAAPAPASFDDSALRLAQLAHRVAELEKRLKQLESSRRSASAKTPRRTKTRKH
ncbi:MAG TPA: hypothetical protein VFR09_08725 [Alphaproteobacteria bacterium]|nr:hypothetical protein [Alphaproteobacteria bacterium]